MSPSTRLTFDGEQSRSPAAQPQKRTRGSANRGKARADEDPDFARNTDTVSRRVLFDPRRDNPRSFNPAAGPAVEQPARRNTGDFGAGRGKDQRKENVAVAPEILTRRSSHKQETHPQVSQQAAPVRQLVRRDADSDKPVMIREPETRNISTMQLISEVRGIYAGLIMVEAKCAEVDKRQHQVIIDVLQSSPVRLLARRENETEKTVDSKGSQQDHGGRQPILNNEQWQALTALHRTLLHEHHDFFLASQHPAANPALKKLAEKYDMPSRMWRHGIHSFLELQRHHLPYSLEHMLAFIYLAYSMMALRRFTRFQVQCRDVDSIVYETVPAFEITWIECLGDLARYRMAIEDESPRDREIWQNVARSWYAKGSDKTPTVGRLYHHLAILARPHILTQLFYYCKSS
jgi:hypothetical protein